MHACGFDSRLSDEGVLHLLDEEGNVVEVLALHVDDTLGGGISDFHHAIQKNWSLRRSDLVKRTTFITRA